MQGKLSRFEQPSPHSRVGNFLPGYQGFMGKFRNYDISSLRFPLKEFSEINFIRSIIISLNEKSFNTTGDICPI